MVAARESLKKCFVLAPIGEDGSDIRWRSDNALKHIIKPVAANCGYEAIRADEISEPGMITHQIVQHILEDDLVIANLTGENPNVYYELALRHAIRKPFIQIVESPTTLPFDVAPARTIYFVNEKDSVERCKQDLARQIEAAEKNLEEVESPISVAIDILQLRKSNNSIEKSNAEVLSMLQDLRGEFVKKLREQSERISELQSLLTTNTQDELTHQTSPIKIIESTGSSNSKEMEWDNFIRQFDYFSIRNLIEEIDKLIGQNTGNALQNTYFHTQYNPHAWESDMPASHISDLSHYHNHFEFEIRTDTKGDILIKRYGSIINISKDDLKNFRDYACVIH